MSPECNVMSVSYILGILVCNRIFEVWAKQTTSYNRSIFINISKVRNEHEIDSHHEIVEIPGLKEVFDQPAE